ncbi:hypothetical protein GmHk_16G045520 [Glycine max]|nr:hypothetical protein GmHk_16G045520 [Glycine max]
MPIGFKMKSNMVSERTLTLGPRLRFRCDEHPPFVVHAPSPTSVGREGVGLAFMAWVVGFSYRCQMVVCD